MKREPRIFLIFILTLLIAGSISAYSTEIYVKTPINKEVQVSVMNNGYLVERFANNSDLYGDFIVNYVSSLEKFDLIIFLKQDNKNLMPSKRLMNVEAGENVYVEMIPAGFEKVETPNETEIENVVNESKVNSTELNETATNNSLLNTSVNDDLNKSEGFSFLSGFSVFSEDIDSKYFYYFAIFFVCLVFVLIAGFVTAKVVRKKSSENGKQKGNIEEDDLDREIEQDKGKRHEGIKVRKLSELQHEIQEKKKAEMSKEDISKQIDDLQKKLDDLQKSLGTKKE